MNWLKEYENCLTLWLPDSLETAKELIPSLNRVNKALQDLMDTKITWQDYLDILQTENINMDEYLDISWENIKANGF